MAGEAIIAVGRSRTAHEFAHEVADLLYSGYDIIAIHPLGEPGIDEKERFLAFIGPMGDSERTKFDAATQVMRLRSSTMHAESFADFETALEFAQERYNLEQETVESHERFEAIKEKFPPPTAIELEQLLVFESLRNMGATTITRGLLDDETPVIVLVSAVHGPDEARITKLAVMINPELADRITIPFELGSMDD